MAREVGCNSNNDYNIIRLIRIKMITDDEQNDNDDLYILLCSQNMENVCFPRTSIYS